MAKGEQLFSLQAPPWGDASPHVCAQGCHNMDLAAAGSTLASEEPDVTWAGGRWWTILEQDRGPQKGPVGATVGCEAAKQDVRTLPVIALGAQQCARCGLLTVMGSQGPGTAAQLSKE